LSLIKIQLVTHKPDEQSKTNKLCIIATTFLLAVGTKSVIQKMDKGVFYQEANQSEHEAEKIF